MDGNPCVFNPIIMDFQFTFAERMSMLLSSFERGQKATLTVLAFAFAHPYVFHLRLLWSLYDK